MLLPKNKPERDEAYLEFIRQLPCCACYPLSPYIMDTRKGKLSPGGEAHHAGRTGKGTGQKCSDYETVPFCRRHHDEHDRIGKKKFQEKYAIDFPKVIRACRTKYGLQATRLF